MGPFTSFLNGVMTVILPINGLKNGTLHAAYLPRWATMKPSRHLGALKRRVTCNCGPRGTVSCGFQVSKEQLEEERLRQEGQEVAGRNAMRFHKTRMDGTANMCC